MRGFTNWQRLTQESVEQHAPDGPAALQVKRVGGLVDYPSGKSAMLWYGYASENAGATLTEHFEDELRQPGTRGYGTLRFRYIPGGQQARETLMKVWHKFVSKFGRPPLLNSESTTNE